MAVRPIIYDPDPILYKKCHPVTKFDKKLGNILTDMTQTMIHANGVGLQARRSVICAVSAWCSTRWTMTKLLRWSIRK